MDDAVACKPVCRCGPDPQCQARQYPRRRGWSWLLCLCSLWTTNGSRFSATRCLSCFLVCFLWACHHLPGGSRWYLSGQCDQPVDSQPVLLSCCWPVTVQGLRVACPSTLPCLPKAGESSVEEHGSLPSPAGVCSKQVQVLPSSPPHKASPQSELLTLKCLGLKLGRLGGEGERRVVDPLGIWQPRVPEPHPRQAGRRTNYPRDIF